MFLTLHEIKGNNRKDSSHFDFIARSGWRLIMLKVNSSDPHRDFQTEDLAGVTLSLELCLSTF